MLIFIADTENELVIPMEKIYFIKRTENKVTIAYNEGSYAFVDSENQAAVPKPELYHIRYESKEYAVEMMRKFYVAAAKNSNVFSF